MESSKHWGAGVLACSNTGVLVAALMSRMAGLESKRTLEAKRGEKG